MGLKSVKNFVDDIKQIHTRFSLPYILKYITFPRLINIANSYIARRFGKIIFKPIRPVTIFIEVVRGCNFSCIMCPANELEIKFMSFDTFKKILEEFKDSLFIYPCGIGEPFLNRDIYDMLEYASGKFIVTAFTNLSKVDPERLVNTGLKNLFVSIDSADPEEFSKIRKNGNFYTFKQNLERILEIKKKKGLRYPEIGFSITLMENNIENIEELINFGLSYGINTFYMQTVFKANFMSPPVNIPTKKQIEKIDYLKRKYRGKAKILLSSHYGYKKGDFFTGYCLFAYTSVFIDVEGKVFPCCCGGSPTKRNENIGDLSNIKSALENRHKFIGSFRKKIPDYCMGCPIYHRKF